MRPISIIISMLFFGFSFSQTPKVDWIGKVNLVNSLSMADKSFSHPIFFHETKIYYTDRLLNDTYLEYNQLIEYDTISKSITRKFPFKYIKQFKNLNISYLYVDNDTIIITCSGQVDKKTFGWYKLYYDFDGKEVRKMQTMRVYEKNYFKKNGFSYNVYNNSTDYLISFRERPNKSNEKESFALTLFKWSNKKFDTIATKTIVLPYDDNVFEPIKMGFLKGNQVFLVGINSVDDELITPSETKLLFIKYSFDSMELDSFQIAIKNNYTRLLLAKSADYNLKIITVLKEQFARLLTNGAREKDEMITGIKCATLNLLTKTIENEKTFHLNDKNLPFLFELGKRNNNSYCLPTSFKLAEYSLNDTLSYLFFENDYLGTAKQGQYGPAFMVKISDYDTFKINAILPYYQIAPNPLTQHFYYNYLLGTKTLRMGNDLIVMYNDFEVNVPNSFLTFKRKPYDVRKNGATHLASINMEGKIKNGILFNDKENGGKLLLQFTRKIDNKRFIVYTFDEKTSSAKFGILHLE